MVVPRGLLEEEIAVARKLTKEEAGGIQFGGPQAKYPWDEWLDGDMWVLERNEDFPSSTLDSLRKAASGAATTRGLKVRSTRLGTTTIVIQAYKEV